jgi:chromosome segregation ATPase
MAWSIDYLEKKYREAVVALGEAQLRIKLAETELNAAGLVNARAAEEAEKFREELVRRRGERVAADKAAV